MDGIKSIAAKMVQVMENIKFVNNDSHNKEQNYQYASDEAVLSEVKKAMVASNVCSFPLFKILSNGDGISNSGKNYNKVEMECELTVVDADSGETIKGNGFGAGIDYGGDKALMKAQTVCHKYALLKLFNIATGNNPEADEEVDKEANAPTPQQTQATPKAGAKNNPCTTLQQTQINSLWQDLGKTEAALKVQLKKDMGVDSVEELTGGQAAIVVAGILGLIKAKKAKDAKDKTNPADGAEAGSAQ